MLEQVLKDFIDDVVLDYKDIIGKIGNLNALPNDLTKTSLVAALISLNGKIASAAGINDAVTATGSTWSSSKITTQIDAAVAALVDGAPSALNTLKELADEMQADSALLDSVVTALGNRVRFDAAQSLTGPQMAQARSNIGAASSAEIGNPNFDYAAYYAQQKAAA